MPFFPQGEEDVSPFGSLRHDAGIQAFSPHTPHTIRWTFRPERTLVLCVMNAQVFPRMREGTLMLYQGGLRGGLKSRRLMTL